MMSINRERRRNKVPNAGKHLTATTVCDTFNETGLRCCKQIPREFKSRLTEGVTETDRVTLDETDVDDVALAVTDVDEVTLAETDDDDVTVADTDDVGVTLAEADVDEEADTDTVTPTDVDGETDDESDDDAEGEGEVDGDTDGGVMHGHKRAEFEAHFPHCAAAAAGSKGLGPKVI